MKRKDGQSLVETCIILVFLCLIFFGLLELSRLTAAKEILEYAASCGARARAVGFNPFMVHKVVRVASIPNAGPLLQPAVAPTPIAPVFQAQRPGDAWMMALRAQPRSPQLPVEVSRIPLFLGAETYGQLPAILDYARWEEIRHAVFDLRAPQVTVHTDQPLDIQMPLLRLFIGEQRIRLEGRADLENHYPLYLGYDTP